MGERIKSMLRIQQIEEELRKEAKTSNLALIQEFADARMKIPAEFIRAYDRAKRHYENAIVKLVNGVCQGCFLAASTGVALVAKAGKSIHICEHCSRLVYCENQDSKN